MWRWWLQVLVRVLCVPTDECGIPGDWGAEDHDQCVEDGRNRES